MSASGSARGRKRKNVAGHRYDPGWEHGIEVDAASKKVSRRMTRPKLLPGKFWSQPAIVPPMEIPF
ncbi:unnamed protein product [Camellia sinensis]